MASVTFSVWRDTGYTEGTLEVPSKTSSLSTPTYTFTDLHPSRDKLFNETQIPAPYENIYDCSYVRAVVDMNNGDDVTVYGWIDSVTASSDNPNNPMTIVKWHVDYWRTYLSTAVFKGGIVKRRPGDPASFATVPPMTYPERYRTASKVMSVVANSNTWWVIFNATVTLFGKLTLLVMGTFPVNIRDLSNSNTFIWGNESGSMSIEGAVSPNIDDIIRGNVDEVLKLDPSTVAAMWISPIPPFAFVQRTGTTVGDIGWGTEDDSWWLVKGASYNDGLSYGYLMRVGEAKPYEVTTAVPNGVSIATHDTRELVVTGFDGEIIARLPWGLSFNTVSTRTIVDSVSAYLEMRFNANTQAILNNAESMTVQVPLIALPLTQNSWSSYVYSGARDVDSQQRANMVTNALLSTALKGGGSAVSAGMTVLESSQQGRLTDMAHKNVSNGMTLYGTGFDVLYYGQTPALVALTMDSYSQSQRTNDINLYGVHVDEPMASTQNLINTGGPLQIANLTVTGPIPVEAKNYFRERFAGGVRIV